MLRAASGVERNSSLTFADKSKTCNRCSVLLSTCVCCCCYAGYNSTATKMGIISSHTLLLYMLYTNPRQTGVSPTHHHTLVSAIQINQHHHTPGTYRETAVVYVMVSHNRCYMLYRYIYTGNTEVIPESECGGNTEQDSVNKLSYSVPRYLVSYI